MRKLLAVAMFFGLCVEGVAHPTSQHLILGSGRDSCGMLTKAEGATKDLMMSWILGYISKHCRLCARKKEVDPSRGSSSGANAVPVAEKLLQR
jgi:hypothetical protein